MINNKESMSTVLNTPKFKGSKARAKTLNIPIYNQLDNLNYRRITSMMQEIINAKKKPLSLSGFKIRVIFFGHFL